MKSVLMFFVTLPYQDKTHVIKGEKRCKCNCASVHVRTQLSKGGGFFNINFWSRFEVYLLSGEGPCQNIYIYCLVTCLSFIIYKIEFCFVQ